MELFNSLYAATSLSLHLKTCSEDFGFCFKHLKARDFVQVFT